MSAVGGRRTYTEEELQAALRDIQSGKLGTRRAAVIYGIPRSTLRNKVYKLAMERERESHLAPLATLADDDPMDDERELSGAEEEKEVEKALQGPLLSIADLVRFADTPEALKAMVLQQLKTGVGGGPESWSGLEHSSLGPYIQLMLSEQPSLVPMLPEIMRKVLGGSSDDQTPNNGENDVKAPPPQSPVNSVHSAKAKTDSSDVDMDDSPANVILKIPSFKPTTSKNGGDAYRNETGALVSPPVTSESNSPPVIANNMLSLREAIAKSISQKFQQSPEPLARHTAAMEIDYKRAGLTPPLAGLPPTIKNHQQHATTIPTGADSGTPPAGSTASIHVRSFPTANNNMKQSATTNSAANNNTGGGGGSGSSGSSQGGKGTRPKRGKYRNYDRDSLVEAVRAVQRGEMSVHRAGSYYGVPHSTLEYKVKERHLMRPRKRDPKPNPVDEKIASMKSQEVRNIPDKMKAAIKPPQKFPPTSPNGIKMPPMFDPTMAPIGYTPPPFPFWPHPSSFSHLPLDYPRNPSTSQFPPGPDFFASQMMQQLQERSARCHPETGKSDAGSLYDGTSANGSFLDGIIRSSLESGVPSTADKPGAAKEDTKNVAPENMSNKALLDQLCRNSRITPLSKPGSADTPSSANDQEQDTIELSNDSSESQPTATATAMNEDDAKEAAITSRIYVKPQFQELTKPENLKPEVLVRFRTDEPDSNGLDPVGASDSKQHSDKDAELD